MAKCRKMRSIASEVRAIKTAPPANTCNRRKADAAQLANCDRRGQQTAPRYSAKPGARSPIGQ
eukprot:2354051-Alexandrium_andersonii.AAC.1